MGRINTSYPTERLVVTVEYCKLKSLWFYVQIAASMLPGNSSTVTSYADIADILMGNWTLNVLNGGFSHGRPACRSSIICPDWIKSPHCAPKRWIREAVLQTQITKNGPGLVSAPNVIETSNTSRSSRLPTGLFAKLVQAKEAANLELKVRAPKAKVSTFR